MPRGKKSNLGEVIDIKKPLRECIGAGAVEATDDRSIQNLTDQLAQSLLAVAAISGSSSEILLGVQQAMHRTASKLLADPETKELGEALQRLALRTQVGVGNPPKQKTERQKEHSSPLNTDLLSTLDFSVRVSNAVENFLAAKVKTSKKDLTVRHFIEAFSKDGRFDPSEFKSIKGIGEATFDEFTSVLKEKSVITDANDWNSDFLEKHAPRS